MIGSTLMALSAGTRLGAYEITAAIGSGGIGEVYRARDTRLSRDVALKILPAALAKDPERLTRFERETKLLASLNHPTTATLYGLHEADGPHFLTMELASGENLERRLQDEPLSQGSIPQ